jgi:hypothetical protein
VGFFEPRGRTGDSEELAWRYRRRFAFNRLKLYICDYATMRHDGYVLSNVGQYSGSELLFVGLRTADGEGSFDWSYSDPSHDV